jgi:hypothetical protein
MKRTLLMASFLFLSTGLAIELSPNSSKAETPLLVQQPADRTLPSAPSQSLQIQLVNPGAELRQQLNLKPNLGVKQMTTMAVKMEMGTSTPDKSMNVTKVPTMVLTIETKANKIDTNGDIHYEFSYAEADLAGDTSTLPTAALDAMRISVKRLVGLKGSAIMDSRGNHKKADFILPEGADNNFKQMVQQMSKSLGQLSAPLPAEAVGKGAKWIISSPSNVGGINLNQIATYELISLQDGVLTLSITMKQEANPQKLTSPQLPAGANVSLKSFASQGQGEVIMRLNQLMPIRSAVSMNSNSEMSIKVAGTPEELTLKTKMLMEMNLNSK